MKKSNPIPTSRASVALYWRYTRHYPVDFAVGAAGSILAVISQSMIPPYIVARIFSRLQAIYAHHQALYFKTFAPYFIWYAAFMLAGVLLWRLQGLAVWRLEVKVRRDQANEIYNHLQAQSQRFHADRFGGALVSQTNKFINAYERLMDDFIWGVLPAIITMIIAVVVLLFITWPVALIMIAIIMLYLALMSRRVARQIPYNVNMAEMESRQTAALADSITNMGTIRAFAGERYESKRFGGVTQEVHKAYRKLLVQAFKTDALGHIQTNSFQILALLIGLVAVTNYHVNVSLLYLVISYVGRIVDRLWEFPRLVRNANRSLGDAAEMTVILGIEPDVKDPAEPESVRIKRGEVVFKGVNFSYPENKEDALFEKLDLKIKPGEKVGLVGPSGGGKTTITKLLLRFMDIQGGEITIDGQNIAAIRQADLRSKIAYVAQEPILFHRSLAENIGYGDLKASQQTIKAVAKMAHADEFISQLPQGYQTLVGERGVKLSGGQRQRVAIARAMLKNAPLLVLDEATSALDSESEALIQDALWKLMEGRTAIVIAHRLSTIQKMDRIIVLEEGRLVEEGSHKELLAKNGAYAKLWARQSGGFIEDEDA